MRLKLKRLTINLNNTAAFFEDEDNKIVTVLTENASLNFEQPDEIIITGDEKSVIQYWADVDYRDRLADKVLNNEKEKSNVETS